MSDEIPEDLREAALKAVYSTDPTVMTAREIADVFARCLLSERIRAQSEIEQLKRDVAALTEALAVRNEALERWENGECCEGSP